jgi:hypothetical protein
LPKISIFYTIFGAARKIFVMALGWKRKNVKLKLFEILSASNLPCFVWTDYASKYRLFKFDNM